MQMAELEGELQSLLRSAEELALRLQPLLAATPTRDEQLNKEPERQPLSPLGDTLRRYRNTVKEVRQQLQDLHQRIGI
jgi:hypothetical protein